jgi:Zn-dependent protease with chaperone function
VIKMFVLLAFLFAVLIAHAATIREVIEQGMVQKLTESEGIDLATTPRIVAAFTRVKAQIGNPLIMLKVVERSRDLAITANNTMIIAQGAETLSDVELEFIMAHEAGHIVLNHKDRRIRVYERHINGEVTEEKAKVANAKIGREMMQLSYTGEFEADTFAMKTLQRLGRSKEDVINAFMNMSRTPDTATHPSTAKRVMNMRRGETNE